MSVTSAAQATAFAKRILRFIQETHQYMGQRIDIGASIGIALAPTWLDRFGYGSTSEYKV